MKNIVNKISGGFLVIFGAVSLFMTLSIFFDLFGIREKEGNYVLSVVVANFVCAILYLLSAYGFFKKEAWTPKIIGTAFGILVIAYLFLILHIKQGGIYEKKTVIAMGFRSGITLLLFIIAKINFKK